jgi:hypothetical protein
MNTRRLGEFKLDLGLCEALLNLVFRLGAPAS